PIRSLRSWPDLSELTFFANAFDGPFVESTSIASDVHIGSSWPYRLINIHIPAELTMTIEPGATLRMGNSAFINVEGALLSEGTADNPVHILPAQTGVGWGSIRFNNATGVLSGTVMLGGNKNYPTLPEQSGMIMAENSSVLIEGGSLLDAANAGNMIIAVD